MDILRDEAALAVWSHRILLMPNARKLIEHAQSSLELDQRTDAAVRRACGLACTKIFLSCAKTLTSTPRLANVLQNIQFCAPGGAAFPPSKEGLESATKKITNASIKTANPLAAILIDLRPNLNLDAQALRQLVDEDRFWDVRRDIVKDICLTLHRAIGLPALAVSYDPMADEERQEELDAEPSIDPHLVMQHYEASEPAVGYYTTPHVSNTVVAGSRNSGSIADFIIALESSNKSAVDLPSS